MNVKAESGTSVLDILKIVLAVALALGGIVAYYWYADLPIYVRAAGVVAGFVAGIFMALQSEPGRELWHFAQGARVELRKVVWPTRQETIQTALLVLAFAVAMGVFFWILDMFLLWATRLLTGQGS